MTGWGGQRPAAGFQPAAGPGGMRAAFGGIYAAGPGRTARPRQAPERRLPNAARMPPLPLGAFAPRGASPRPSYPAPARARPGCGNNPLFGFPLGPQQRKRASRPQIKSGVRSNPKADIKNRLMESG